MSENKEISVIEKLSKPLPQEAIQRTKGKDTQKGYDTTGYGYQHVVDRFNNVCGENWGYDYKIIKEIEGIYKNSGKPFIDITIDIGIWINDKENIRRCTGSHTAMNYGDALKGAITNGFKKTAAFWGVGREAYAGEIDEDNQPLPGKDDEKIISKQNEKSNNMNTFEENYNKLSDDIKQGFKLAGWFDQKIKAKCLQCNFDEEKLKAEINKDLK